jgi:MFS family permease
MGQNDILNIQKASYISEQEKKFARTRKMSIHEGNFGVLSSVIADNYIVPFALALGADAFQVGIISSSGGFFAPIGQIIGSREMEIHSRKIILFIGIFGQLILMACFMLLAFFYQFQYISLEITWTLLYLYLIYVFCAGLMTPPWFSVMGDVVPENQRGRYFAKRNLLNNIVAVSVTLIIAYLLDWYKAINLILFGFMLIFLIGFIARSLSFTFFNFHYFPPFEFQSIDHVGMKKFVSELPKSNFGHFTIFVALLIFAQWISAPFFTVYMLVELDFSYTELIFINMSLTLFGLFFFPLFGWLADKKGNVVLLRLGSIIIIFLPLMWLFLDTPTEILLGPQLFGGIGWTAFNLATANIIYDNIPSHKRGEYVALYNFFLGIGIILGGLLGSIIVQFIPISFMRPILFVFLLSSIARGVVVIIFLPRIKEVRKVEVKAIFNVKNMPVYKWLYDISMREHSRLKILKPRKRNRNNNHS